MATYRFEISKSNANNQFYWNFKAPNNEIVCQSEGYVYKSSAEHAINVIKAQAATADVKDHTVATSTLGW